MTIEIMMLMMIIGMKAEEGDEEFEMMMKTQGEEQKGREAEAGAGIMDQEEEHQGAEGQSTLLLHQKCQV